MHIFYGAWTAKEKILEGESMDKIQLLQERKAKIAAASKSVRADIAALIDENSFVELSAFSFSKNEFYNEEIAGEGVVTGFATINDSPVYIVAQNFEALQGGVSKAACDKIVKCIDLAEQNATPILYVLNTHGVQVGEGVTVLEGLANVLRRSARLKGITVQYALINGDVYGSAAILAATADVCFFMEKKSVLAVNSPFVLSAKAGKNLPKEEIGGIGALTETGLASISVSSLAEVKEKISEINAYLSQPMIDAELNASVPALNENVSAEGILHIFESYVELGKTCASEVRTVIGRIGGISVAAIVFDGKEEAVALTENNLAKIKAFAEFSACYNLPFVTFADVQGLLPCACVNNSRAMRVIGEYLNAMESIDTAKLAVVYNRAIGLGYSLFASKSAGFDYTCAFANAQIALFDGAKGAQIELGGDCSDKAALAARYADENADPIHAAKDGYIDAIVEPQFVKQHLVASLQMLMR